MPTTSFASEMILSSGLFVTSFITPPLAEATSARMIDPFRGVETISLEITIGDAIRVDDPDARPLFDADHERADAFKTALRQIVAENLRDRAIDVENGAAHTLSFVYYGGTLLRWMDCEDRGIFLLEVAVSVLRDTDGESESLYQRGVLGVVNTQHPESALLAAAEAVLRELRTHGE